MRLRFLELQESDKEAQKIRVEEPKSDYEEVDGVLHHQRLPLVPEVIQTELISRHHYNPLIRHFGINKTRELVGRKYYWTSLKRDVESYVQGYDDCLTLKAVCHKPYGELQSLLIPTHG